eukprot:360633-Chlamydomonas_euryale.AAC.8
MQQDWGPALLTDGLHFTPAGNHEVFLEIHSVIAQLMPEIRCERGGCGAVSCGALQNVAGLLRCGLYGAAQHVAGLLWPASVRGSTKCCTAANVRFRAGSAAVQFRAGQHKVLQGCVSAVPSGAVESAAGLSGAVQTCADCCAALQHHCSTRGL